MGAMQDEAAEQEAMSRRLLSIEHKILVLSGKGGVGKSTVAAQLAMSLAKAGKLVGLLDVDIHGPSIPALLGLGRREMMTQGESIVPIICNGMKVMSIGFLLADNDKPVIWRGPMKMSLIRQFLKDVKWGALDYLVIDCPPGTGDEPLSVAQAIENASGAVVVTTPQEIALLDVRKSITFCRQVDLPVLGVVENMSGFACPHCGEVSDIFRSGGGERMAEEMGVPFLGRIPIEPALVMSGDQGSLFDLDPSETAAGSAFESVVESIVEKVSKGEVGCESCECSASSEKENGFMRIAIPVADGKLCAHFGHCPSFALIDVDLESKKIVEQTSIDAPEHQPDLLPPWLSERGVNLIIAGGMGQRAQQLFVEQGVKVIVGAPAEAPEVVAQAYLGGTLETGDNVCDH